MALCPSGQGVGLELRWALPAQVRTLSVSFLPLTVNGESICVFSGELFLLAKRLSATAWPSGLRRQLKALVRKGVGSNPTAVSYISITYNCLLEASSLAFK